MSFCVTTHLHGLWHFPVVCSICTKSQLHLALAPPAGRRQAVDPNRQFNRVIHLYSATLSCLPSGGSAVTGAAPLPLPLGAMALFFPLAFHLEFESNVLVRAGVRLARCRTCQA